MERAKILLDSIGKSGMRLVTFELEFPRYILPQLLTHRVFSRNTASSRAVPVKKMIEKIRKNPAIPNVFYQKKNEIQSHTINKSQNLTNKLYTKSINNTLKYTSRSEEHTSELQSH